MTNRAPTFVAWLVLAVSGVAGAWDGPPAAPGPKDRCATCGMLVAKYPAWVAAIVRPDGSCLYFDGPKDLFRFLARPGADTDRKAEVWVTDYYTAKPIKARDAVFVRGSDVLGPMGVELVPLASAELAEEFRADHGGEPPLDFEDVDDAVLEALE